MNRPSPPPEPDLHHAARIGDIDELARLHAEGADLNMRFDLELDNGPHLRGLTPLMVAARSIDGATVQTLQWLLEHGADLHAQSEGDDTAAWYAAGKGGRWWFHEWRLVPDHVDRLRFLLDAGLDPLETNFIGRSLLTEACRAGDPARVRLLLQRGAPAVPGFDPAEATGRNRNKIANWEKHFRKEGASAGAARRRAKQIADAPAKALSSYQIPLFQAAESGCADCVHLILQNGADPNTRDEHGETALMYAASPEVVRRLIDTGADPLMVDSHGYDALKKMLHGEDCGDACGPRLDAAKALIECGVPIESGPGSWSRLYDAAFCHAADAVEFLLDLGADPHAPQSGGATPLHAICWQGEYQDEETNAAAERIIKRLIAAGIDPNARDEEGGTPLHEAVSGDWGNATAVRLLLKHGAQPDAADSAGMTPLMLAAINGEHECVRLLLDAGADPRTKNREGKSTLDFAKGYDRDWNSILGSTVSALAMMYDDDVLPDERNEERKCYREAAKKARECLRLLTEAARRKGK